MSQKKSSNVTFSRGWNDFAFVITNKENKPLYNNNKIRMWPQVPIFVLVVTFKHKPSRGLLDLRITVIPCWIVPD